MKNLTPEEIIALVGKETIERIYNDTLSPSAVELGKATRDIAKTFRLFLAPFQLGAAYQDRFEKYLDKVRSKVPVEDQIESPPSIAGPVLEKLKYLDDENYLKELYLNLLTKSIDKKNINQAHPAFVNLISQLSPDEAIIINEIVESEYNLTLYIQQDTIVEYGAIPKAKMIKNNFPNEKLSFPENLELYIDHLHFLNIIKITEYKSDKDKDLAEKTQEEPVIYYRIFKLSEFGDLFYKACVE